MAGILKGLLKGLGKNKAITYQEAKELARHKSLDVRRELATRQDIKPEILYYLAEDPSPEVRREIAINTVAPSHADLLLATDSDEGVRTGLAGKIAKLAPELTDDEQDKVHKMTHEALEILARDQTTRVRQVLSEALKDVANAPPEVINRLARDLELVVSGPVLEFSPVLSDEDLLDIIANDPVHGALSAISRRPTVDESVADAIAAADDVEAIAFLLANPSAQIREETLDSIIDRAPDVDPWHEPLVRRPKLPAQAAGRLARFVADNLLDILTERKDLDPQTAEVIKEMVHRRLEKGGEENEIWKSTSAGASPLDTAKELKKAGKLDETAVLGALQAGEHEFVTAALSVLAGIPLGSVDKIVSAQSAKGIVSVVWKAGLSMKMAVQVQKKVAQVSPRNLLSPSANSDFPLTEDEMSWQLDFLSDL